MKNMAKKSLSMMLAAVIILLSLSFATSAADTSYKPYDDSRYFEYGDYAVHYRISPAKGEYKGRILMIHGFMCSTYSWRNMAALLSEAGYECVMADLPDFGYSTRETKDMTIIPREKLMIELMNSIAPGEQWIIAGHSMGGGVAVNIAEQIKAKALLLYCPCPQNEFPESVKGLVQSSFMEGLMNGFFKYGTKITPFVKLVIYMATNNFKFAMNYDVEGVTGPVQYDGFGAGICEMMYNVLPTDLENTGKITCPVLLCNGTNDIILNDSQKGAMLAAFPDAETHTLDKAGHQCIEDRADELCGITLEFLK